MKIYIIRHGETNANRTGCFQGWVDNPLNEKGVELARITGQGMNGIRFDRCISSPLIRARQTAELVLRHSGNEAVPILTDDRLKEVYMGDWEGKTFRMENGEIRPEAKEFFRDPFAGDGFPNGEHARDVCRRTQAFLRELCAEESDDTCLVSTHGFAMRAMLNFLYEDPDDFWHRHVPYNCEVNILEAENGEIRFLEQDRIYYDRSAVVDRFSEVKEQLRKKA